MAAFSAWLVRLVAHAGNCVKSSSPLADFFAQLGELVKQLLDLCEQSLDLCEQSPDLWEQSPDLWEGHSITSKPWKWSDQNLIPPTFHIQKFYNFSLANAKQAGVPAVSRMAENPFPAFNLTPPLPPIHCAQPLLAVEKCPSGCNNKLQKRTWTWHYCVCTEKTKLFNGFSPWKSCTF